ncbi:hypothetical protein F3Y22_tig00111640pilonHSYRG00090 [Hibiscus syriacus]|uniref:RNase H type-1 domain-containing protein n=1 Tax=Hibiscus syriacus TaxID=106335 RepID=A0A6A2Y4R3_HIBSY|nr:hypothetical protein F3Y22_tig00111640pilonHSYRG00090 [Hibiscus syriacus]
MVHKLHFCSWMLGFLKHLGRCSILDSELWGVYEGLRIAWEEGIRKLWIEVDSKETLAVITKDLAYHGTSSLEPHIHNLLQRDWELKFYVVPREANTAADCLAKIAWNHLGETLVFQTPPTAVTAILHVEAGMDSS